MASNCGMAQHRIFRKLTRKRSMALFIGPSVGSCGTAAYRREQVIVSDIATRSIVGPIFAISL